MPPPAISSTTPYKVSDVLLNKTFSSTKRLLKSTSAALSRIRYSGIQTYQPPEPERRPSLDPREQSSNLTEEQVRMSGALPSDDCRGRHLEREKCVTESCARKPQTSVL